MPDKEKVIKGLELCSCLTDICYEHECPYYNGVKEICGEIEDIGYSSDNCKEKLHSDAIALLAALNDQQYMEASMIGEKMADITFDQLIADLCVAR